jgi:transcriptional regulator with PAS, ATPase and Fis domain
VKNGGTFLTNNESFPAPAQETGVYLTDGSAFTLGVNKAYELLSEIEEKEVIGRHMQKLEEEGFYDRSVTLLVLKHKAPVTIEQKILRTRKHVVVTGNPIFNQVGDIIFVVTTVYPRELCPKVVEGAESMFPFSPITNIVAASKIMQKILLRAVQVATTDSTVLILGESGVGKEVIAKVIHQFSSRRNKPLVKVSASAIPEGLLESELFGYQSGAFTGALKSGKYGLVHSAAGGTLFLDEIGDVSSHTQVKLLRLIEEKEIYSVGSVSAEHVDVRILAATNRDLPYLIKVGQFREDLFYRLNVLPIYIPPLRERVEDIYPLAEHFLTLISRGHKVRKQLTPSAAQALTDHTWPGNVRELYNVMERLVVLCPQDKITKDHVLEELSFKFPTMKTIMPAAHASNFRAIMDNFEKELIHQTLRQHNGNMHNAAAALGMHRTTLIRKLQKYKTIL